MGREITTDIYRGVSHIGILKTPEGPDVKEKVELFMN